MKKLIVAVVSCAVAGAGVGVLMGLSGSPVVSGVLTAVLGVVCAVVGGLAGVNPGNGNGAALKVNPAPVAVLVVGIVLGAMSGIHMRTNLWFGPTGALAARVGLPEQEVRLRAYEQLFPPREPATPDNTSAEEPSETTATATVEGVPAKQPTAGKTAGKGDPKAQREEKKEEKRPAPPAAAQAVLLNDVSEEDCVRFQSIEGDALRAQLRATGNRKAIAIAAIADDAQLEFAVKEILCVRR